MDESGTDGPGCGRTVWFTGLPSAGKSTIAAGLAARLRADGVRVEVLDGDEIRRNLAPDLGFSRADREENVRRVAFFAGVLARNGVTVLVPVIAPYATSRAAARAAHAAAGVPFTEVFVDASVAVCSARDVKGLYARQREGLLTGLTGVDDPYEPPTAADIVLPTANRSVAESVAAVHAHLALLRAAA